MANQYQSSASNPTPVGYQVPQQSSASSGSGYGARAQAPNQSSASNPTPVGYQVGGGSSTPMTVDPNALQRQNVIIARNAGQNDTNYALMSSVSNPTPPGYQIGQPQQPMIDSGLGQPIQSLASGGVRTTAGFIISDATSNMLLQQNISPAVSLGVTTAPSQYQSIPVEFAYGSKDIFTINNQTGNIGLFSQGTNLPSFAQQISPTTGERLYGSAGLTSDQLFSNFMSSASIGQKMGLAFEATFIPENPFGISFLASAGKDYSQYEKLVLSKYGYDTTGQNVQSPFGYVYNNPLTRGLAVSAIAGGAIEGALVYAGQGLTIAAASFPVVNSLLATGTSYLSTGAGILSANAGVIQAVGPPAYLEYSISRADKSGLSLPAVITTDIAEATAFAGGARLGGAIADFLPTGFIRSRLEATPFDIKGLEFAKTEEGLQTIQIGNKQVFGGSMKIESITTTNPTGSADIGFSSQVKLTRNVLGVQDVSVGTLAGNVKDIVLLPAYQEAQTPIGLITKSEGEMSAGYGNAYYVPKGGDYFQQFKFTALSKDLGEAYGVITGRPVSASVGLKLSDVGMKGELVNLGDSFTGQFGVSETERYGTIGLKGTIKSEITGAGNIIKLNIPEGSGFDNLGGAGISSSNTGSGISSSGEIGIAAGSGKNIFDIGEIQKYNPFETNSASSTSNAASFNFPKPSGQFASMSAGISQVATLEGARFAMPQLDISLGSNAFGSSLGKSLSLFSSSFSGFASKSPGTELSIGSGSLISLGRPSSNLKIGSALDFPITNNILDIGIGTSFFGSTKPISSQGFNFNQEITPKGNQRYGSEFSSDSISTSSGALSSAGFPIAFPVFPSLGGFTIPNPKTRGRKNVFGSIAPSFTAIVENIYMKSPLKVSKTFGVNPFQTRGLYTGKGKYAQITDL